ncbi:hypothetical protein [Terrabacter sp. Soil810]|uniref:hypothetical protein n=1 Tax=Terrabacter sp. Soil810 TaxID=1736418 RepID=UPI00071069DC|nr:hypothetical protein [Terrabacter sp. Soil810]KRF38144.1 hypothetical protein ASG96_16865 [Terrabacter sp. Soil810]
MTEPVDADHAHRILLDHADRKVTGPLEDPAVLAAVVGVERLVVAAGSTDEAVLRSALTGDVVADADPDRVAALVAEARSHVMAGLLRRATGQAVDAGIVNPASGGYEITTDATLLRAAVRAAQGSIDAMPYYGARYGARGSRFATTDSAWLVSLATLAEDRAVHQVEWLSRVLAARGMPSWLLEIHLDALVAEVRSVADSGAVGSLPVAADALGRARRRHVDDDLLRSADSWADEALGDALPVPRAGALMAAAVADERAGVTRDDRALVDWLTDSARSDESATTRLLGVRQRILDEAR